MACHYFSMPAKSLVAAQMHKMVFRHVSLLCTLGAVAAAAVLRMFRSKLVILTRTGPHESTGLTCPTRERLRDFTKDVSRSLTCPHVSTGPTCPTRDPLRSLFRSRANCVTRTLLCIPCGREPEKARSEDALTNGQK